MEIGFDINVAVANVTWAMVAGERSRKGEIRPFLEAVNKGIELASTSAVLLFMPFLAKIFPERYLGIDQVRIHTFLLSYNTSELFRLIYHINHIAD